MKPAGSDTFNVYAPAGGLTYALAARNAAVAVKFAGLTLALDGTSVNVSEAPVPEALAKVAALMNRKRAVNPE